MSSAQTDEPPADLTTWVTELDGLLAELDTTDCTVACAALESMMRAADRICEIDAGPPCTRARDKVEGARKRVLAACPDCQVATKDANQPGSTPSPPPADGDDKPKAENRHSELQYDAAPSPAPPPSERGGCATCTLGVSTTPGGVHWVLLLVGIAVVRRLRSR